MQQLLAASDQYLSEVSIDQHHDAIAGTAMQYVTNDYQTKLVQAAVSGEAFAKEHVAKVINFKTGILSKNGAASVLTCSGK